MKVLFFVSLTVFLMSFACTPPRHSMHSWDYVQHQNVYDAARTGNLDDIKALYLIDNDTISVADERGFTPLILAAYHDQEKVIDFLLEKEVEIDNEKQTQTALQGSCYKGYSSIAKKLLEAGAHPNYKDLNGMTALHYAVQFGHTSIVKELIKHNADPALKDNNGVSPIDIAKQQDDAGMLAILGVK